MANLPSCEDYEVSINVASLIKCPKLRYGHVEKNALGTTIRYVGGFCIVFPFYKASGEKTAVRCWIASIENARERTRLIAEELNRVKLPYFVNFEYETEGIATNCGVQPIVLMDWVNANSLKDYLQDNLSNPDVLRRLAESFKSMTCDLHKAHISHGDLQHGNIMVRDDGTLVLVDYDSMYVPALSGYRDEIKGLVGYQHPSRWKNEYVTEKADYFSELVIYTSIMALSYFPLLWEELKIADSETLLFSADDIKSKGTSSIFGKLDSKPELKPLSEALKAALRCLSLDKLLPLEQAIVPQEVRIRSCIRKQWNNPQSVERPEYVPDTNNVRKQWNKVKQG